MGNQNTPCSVFEVEYANPVKQRALLLADKFRDVFVDSPRMQEKEN